MSKSIKLNDGIRLSLSSLSYDRGDLTYAGDCNYCREFIAWVGGTSSNSFGYNGTLITIANPEMQYGFQLGFPFSNDIVKYRRLSNGVWSVWKSVTFS